MTEAGEPIGLIAAVRRQWVIVLVAALVGLVVAGVLARSETVDRSKATQQVTVIDAAGRHRRPDQGGGLRHRRHLADGPARRRAGA